MKKRFAYYTGILLAIAGIMSSCSKDDYTGTENATVTMTFSTRSDTQEGSDSQLASNERMKTLRVIVARHSSGEVIYNTKSDIDGNETSKKFTFKDLTTNQDGEDIDFYAIANEDFVRYGGDWNVIFPTALKEFQLGEISFSEETPIPQTAFSTIHVSPSSGDKEMQLQFAVAKIRLNIINKSATDQTISDIKVSGINMQSTPLFANAPLSEESSGTAEFPDMKVIANSTKTQECYIYENTGGAYKLTAMWNGRVQELNIAQNITEIERGTILDIRITLHADVNIEPEFNIQVNSWTEKDVDIPAFN